MQTRDVRTTHDVTGYTQSVIDRPRVNNHGDWMEDYRNGVSMSEIASHYGVSRSTVWGVIRKKYGVRS